MDKQEMLDVIKEELDLDLEIDECYRSIQHRRVLSSLLCSST